MEEAFKRLELDLEVLEVHCPILRSSHNDIAPESDVSSIQRRPPAAVRSRNVISAFQGILASAMRSGK